MRDPDTILYPNTFKKYKPAGFDGIFDWQWVNEAFADTKIKCMDFDGVIERCGHFLVLETKSPGANVPQGQYMTLKRLWMVGCFTIFFIIGKNKPREMSVWWERDCDIAQEDDGKESFYTDSMAQTTFLVKKWRKMSENAPNKKFMCPW